MRVSSRVMALDTVACDSENSPAVRAKEPVSATLAKMAQASRSGSLLMLYRFLYHIKYGMNAFLYFLF